MVHQKQKSVSKTSARTDRSPSSFLKNAFRSAWITWIIGAGLIFLCAFPAYFSQDPSRLIRPLGILAAFLTAFFGGIVTGRIHRHSALPSGMFNGSVLLGCMLLLSLFFRKEASDDPFWISVLLPCGILILSVLGTFFGLPRTHSPKKRHKPFRS